jgi:hypothetical protein
MKQFIPLVILFVLLVSCKDDDPVAGGSCVYDEIPGTAEITEIVVDTDDGRLCDNAVVVYFDFVPTDPSATVLYRFPNWPDIHRRLIVADGKNPPSSWVEAEGLTVGSEHACVRKEETKGTCTPVLFTFPDVDYSGWVEYCEK